MRTTLDLPNELIEEARRSLGFVSKTDTVVFALKEVVRRSRIDEHPCVIGGIGNRQGGQGALKGSTTLTGNTGEELETNR